MFMIDVADDGLKVDFDVDRNWLIHSYLAGELQMIDQYLVTQTTGSNSANSQSVTFSDALNILNEQAQL